MDRINTLPVIEVLLVMSHSGIYIKYYYAIVMPSNMAAKMIWVYGVCECNRTAQHSML